jgi:hypothetical protein
MCRFIETKRTNIHIFMKQTIMETTNILSLPMYLCHVNNGRNCHVPSRQFINVPNGPTFATSYFFGLEQPWPSSKDGKPGTLSCSCSSVGALLLSVKAASRPTLYVYVLPAYLSVEKARRRDHPEITRARAARCHPGSSASRFSIHTCMHAYLAWQEGEWLLSEDLFDLFLV